MPISNLHMNQSQKECDKEGGNELGSGHEEAKREG